MLVLSRKRNESIMAGGPCEVFVVKIQGAKVSLGFRAAPEVPIHRREVWEKIQTVNGQDRPEAA